MAAFSVAFDGTRVVDASSITGWTAETATPTAEPDFFYQGTGSISAQIKTSENGFFFTSTAQDMTTPKVAILKILATNKDVLDGNGMILRIGSVVSVAYYQYNSIFTASTYPIPGGFQVVAIDPNVSQWRSATVGSPSLSAVIYWAIRADFSATSKSQNVAIDAIDHVTNGKGLTGTAGDGASADGTFTDFITSDEGTANNRWGVVQTRDGILYVNGVLTIGSSGAATEFTDTNRVLVFPHHRVTNGFCGIDFNIENASTVISATSCFFSGRGALFSSDDTRPDYAIVGTAGVCTISGSTFSVFRQIDWNSDVTALNTTYVDGLRVVGDGADLRGAKLSGCTGAADSSYLGWNVATDVDGKLDDSSFTKGTTATHAIELGTSSPTTVTLRGIAFSGYNASNAQNDSTIHVRRTTGTVTINLVGCTGNISYKTDGATVVLVSNPVTLTVTAVDASTSAALQSVYVLVLAGTDFNGGTTVTISRSGSTATVAHTAHGFATGEKVRIRGANEQEYNGIFTITVTGANEYTYTVSGTPATPATGTIKAALAIIDGLTNASGVISGTRSWPADQAFVGRARRGTVRPTYKAQPLTGTIDSGTGASATAPMTAD